MKNLIAFDCDETFWTTPYVEDDYFMSLPESINRYDFEYREEIVKIYNEKRKNPDNKFVILTNRAVFIKKLILERLKKDKGIEFDYTLFRCCDRNKGHRLANLIDKLGDIENVEFYDDKQKHRKSIRKLRKKYPNINFKIFAVEHEITEEKN